MPYRHVNYPIFIWDGARVDHAERPVLRAGGETAPITQVHEAGVFVVLEIGREKIAGCFGGVGGCEIDVDVTCWGLFSAALFGFSLSDYIAVDDYFVRSSQFLDKLFNLRVIDLFNLFLISKVRYLLSVESLRTGEFTADL